MQVHLLDQLLAISSLFQQDMQRAFAGTALTETRVHMLWALHHGGPKTQQSLSTAMQTTPRNISAITDSFIEAGYVVRAPHPTDRRAVLVTLTEPAQVMMQRMQADHEALSARLLEAVSEEDRPAMQRGIAAVLSCLDQLVQSESVHYEGIATSAVQGAGK